MRPNVLLPFFFPHPRQASRSSLDTYTRVEEEFASLPVQVALKPIRCKVKTKAQTPFYRKFLTNSLSLSLSRKRFRRKKSVYNQSDRKLFVNACRVSAIFLSVFRSLTSPSPLPSPLSPLSSRLISASPFLTFFSLTLDPAYIVSMLLISGRVSLSFSLLSFVSKFRTRTVRHVLAKGCYYILHSLK